MNKKFIKISGVMIIAIASFLGVNFSQKKVNISGELASTTLISLGTQAKAYCNEATYWPEINNGSCSGPANDASTRCNITAGTVNCTTTKL